MTEENINKRTAELEAMLFAYGEPLSIARLAELLGAEKDEISGYIRNLEAEYANAGRGLIVISNEGSVQLGTKAEFKDRMAQLMKAELQEELTPAALETLAIIAYAGPLPRSTIDYIRGVNSSFMLRALLLRGLIERTLEQGKANTYRYTVSFELLAHLGISRIEELPDYGRLRDVVAKFQASP